MSNEQHDEFDGVCVRDVRALVADDPTAEACNTVRDDAPVFVVTYDASGQPRYEQCTDIFVREVSDVGVSLVLGTSTVEAAKRKRTDALIASLSKTGDSQCTTVGDFLESVVQSQRYDNVAEDDLLAHLLTCCDELVKAAQMARTRLQQLC